MTNKTHLKNEELILVYNYLHQKIDGPELAVGLGHSRTNLYYYIGRAVHFWLKIGVLRFRRIKNTNELGGKDIT